MRIKLNNIELVVLFRQPQSTKGDGGFQKLLVDLQKKVDRETGIIDLSEDDLEKIPRYAFDYKNGGWETRLKKIFARNLGLGLGRTKLKV